MLGAPYSESYKAPGPSYAIRKARIRKVPCNREFHSRGKYAIRKARIRKVPCNREFHSRGKYAIRKARIRKVPCNREFAREIRDWEIAVTQTNWLIIRSVALITNHTLGEKSLI